MIKQKARQKMCFWILDSLLSPIVTLAYSADSEPVSSHVKHKNREIKYRKRLAQHTLDFQPVLAFLLPKWYQSSEKQQLEVWSADSASLKILWQDNETASRCWRHLSFYATPSHVAYPGVLILVCTQMTSNVTLQHHPPPSVLDMCVQPPDDTDGKSNKNLKHKS